MSNQVSIEQLTQIITEQVTKKLEAEFEGKLAVALAQVNTAIEQKVDKISLGTKEKYEIVSDVDGLSFSKKNKTSLTIARNGQLSTGTKTPRTVGVGSAHFKMGNSEAIMPTSGVHSTRGIIVESDSDDDKTFSHRVVSRSNRQGVNVMGDGALSVGNMKKLHDAKLTVYQNDEEQNGISINLPSKQFLGTALTSDMGAAQNKNVKHYSAISNTGDAGYESEVARIDGTGSVFSNNAFYSNNTGYAEMFRWADGNARNEDRNGFTVALNDKGELRIAGEGDDIIGVVMPSASVIGNSQWNHWHSKFFSTKFREKKLGKYDIVEWLETETSLLKSYYKSDLPDNFSMPIEAIEIQTDADGNDLYKPLVNSAFDVNMEYTGRQDRPSWATVCLLGSVPVYKGQLTGSNWIKIKDLNDELDLMIIK